jgi:hypothetical protein
MPTLTRFTPPSTVSTKTGIPLLPAVISSTTFRSVVLTDFMTGSETDICVLATALSAVDLGYRVVIVRDALCSSSDEGHET